MSAASFSSVGCLGRFVLLLELLVGLGHGFLRLLLILFLGRLALGGFVEVLLGQVDVLLGQATTRVASATLSVARRSPFISATCWLFSPFQSLAVLFALTETNRLPSARAATDSTGAPWVIFFSALPVATSHDANVAVLAAGEQLARRWRESDERRDRAAVAAISFTGLAASAGLSGGQIPQADDVVGAAGGDLLAFGDDRDGVDRRGRFDRGDLLSDRPGSRRGTSCPASR